MIKNLSSSSPSLTVLPLSPVYVYGNGLSAGEMRWNPNTQNIEVYDGNSWVMVSQTATVSLTWEAEEAIRWARDKMTEEKILKERMAKHPGLKDAYEKFKIMDILTIEEEKVGTN